MENPLGGMPDFDERLLPGLLAIPCFRLATDEEISAAYAEYSAGRHAALVDVWAARAQPTRATVRGLDALMYRSSTWMPRPLIRAVFLATVRAVLAAGYQFFDEQLKPDTARAIRERLSFLTHRHGHIPPGFTPAFAFPAEFAAFVDAVPTDEAVARFQLCAALNEVQQAAYSHHFADRFGLPEIHRHAALERDMAIDYLGRFAPNVTETLFRQSILILDGLNAAVFALVCRNQIKVIGGSLVHESGWAEFVRRLTTP